MMYFGSVKIFFLKNFGYIIVVFDEYVFLINNFIFFDGILDYIKL